MGVAKMNLAPGPWLQAHAVSSSWPRREASRWPLNTSVFRNRRLANIFATLKISSPIDQMAKCHLAI
jgi:hypothetical protein